MKSNRRWLKSAVLSLWVFALMSSANASRINDDQEPPKRQRSSKSSKNDVEQNKQSTSKKRRAKKQGFIAIVDENARRTETQFPDFDKFPKDLFWTNLAPSLEYPDIINLGKLSKAMKINMSHMKKWYFEHATSLLKNNGVKSIPLESLQQIISFHVPLIEADIPFKAPVIEDCSDHLLLEVRTMRNSLKHYAQRMERGYHLAHLYYFPKDLSPLLEGLNKLNLSRLGLGELPNCIGQLVNLESIEVARNKLTSLPPGFSRLKRLKSFKAWNNRFTSFPVVLLNCKSLEVLDLGGNVLSSLSENIGKLQGLTKLMLSHNQLTTLPKEISACDKLEVLYLRRNPLLKSLPESMKHMSSLEIIYLYGTPFNRGSNLIREMDIDWVWLNKGR
jgi:hypothetical protein